MLSELKIELPASDAAPNSPSLPLPSSHELALNDARRPLAIGAPSPIEFERSGSPAGETDREGEEKTSAEEDSKAAEEGRSGVGGVTKGEEQRAGCR